VAFAGEFDGCYRPISEHGLVGDLHTVALVGTDGTIDWYCCPAFDAPSSFGAILGCEEGGNYALRPQTADWTSKQLYFPDTNGSDVLDASLLLMPLVLFIAGRDPRCSSRIRSSTATTAFTHIALISAAFNLDRALG